MRRLCGPVAEKLLSGADHTRSPRRPAWYAFGGCAYFCRQFGASRTAGVNMALTMQGDGHFARLMSARRRQPDARRRASSMTDRIVKQPRPFLLAAPLSPRFAPVAITARGGGAPRRRKGGECRDGFADHRATPPGAPTAAVLGIGTVLPGTQRSGISPAFAAPVQPRKRQPLVVAADGDLLPPGRAGASRNAQDAASVRLRRRNAGFIEPSFRAGYPTRRSVPL